RRDALWGYVDLDGNEVIAPQFFDVDSFGGGYARARRKSGSGIIDRDGHQVVAFEYDSVWRVGEGLFAVANPSYPHDEESCGGVGLVDVHGRVLLPTIHESIAYFEKGRARVC